MLKYEYLYSIVYFLRICVGFQHATGLRPPARAPTCKKPLPVLVLCVMPSKCSADTGWRSISWHENYVQLAFYHACELHSL